MSRSHWKKGHTVYLPKDYKFKHSIPDLPQWLSANKVIWKSFSLLAPVKCLPSPTYIFSYTLDLQHKCLYGSCWHMEPPYPPMMAGLPNYSSVYHLFFTK